MGSATIAVVAGSHRHDSESGRVARYLAERLATTTTFEPWVFDLAGNPLPLWDPGVWKDEDPWPEVWHPTRQRLRDSVGVILVSPEWAGMVPPALKNLLLLCGNAELAHKPGLAVGVSSGLGGAYPLAELRVSGTKNNHLVWIPEQLALRHVGSLLHGEEPASDTDASVRARIDYALGVFALYADAFTAVRQHEHIDLQRYKFGM